jgi:heme A synthase
MTDPRELSHPVPRWLHAWAVLCAAATFLLLLVGQLVTSFRAGMADPVWPTEPWYLFSNYKLDLGYLIEHSHRIIAWSIGVLVTVLGVGLWRSQPPSWLRGIGLLGLLVMLAGFLMFHGELGAQRNRPTAEMTWPVASTAVTLLGLTVALGAAVAGVMAGLRGAGIRLLGALALLAVMIQGLLGGFRVKLNELVGTDLAAVHGVFAQVVFGLLVSVTALTARPPLTRLPAPQGRLLRRWSVVLVGLLFAQVVWGAMIRHDPTPLTQRLHFLTAFLATALAVWVLNGVFTLPAARARVGTLGWLLVALLALQVYLGVEAWMVRFAQYTLPELVPITPLGALTRTAHALVGTALLATSVALAVLLGRSVGEATTPAADADGELIPRAAVRPAEVVGTGARGEAR